MMRAGTGDAVVPERVVFRQLSFGELTKYRPLLEEYIGAVSGNDPAELCSRMLSGHSQCWALLAVVEGRTAPMGIAVTKLLDDPLLKRRVVFIDLVSAALSGLDPQVWAYAEGQILGWAKTHGCSRSETLVLHDAVVKRAEALGYSRVGVLVAKEF